MVGHKAVVGESTFTRRCVLFYFPEFSLKRENGFSTFDVLMNAAKEQGFLGHKYFFQHCFI